MQIGRVPTGAQSPLLNQLQNRSVDSQQTALNSRIVGDQEKMLAMNLAMQLLPKSGEMLKTLQIPPFGQMSMPDMSAFKTM